MSLKSFFVVPKPEFPDCSYKDILPTQLRIMTKVVYEI